MKRDDNASKRMSALSGYRILDTPTENDFDDIVKLAAEAFGAPIAVVNLIADDRQWFKAEVGIGVRELPLDVSICAHALLEQNMMIVPDTRADPRFACNPLVIAEKGLRFYAGALLKTPDGLPIGTVCVLDHEPRPQGITSFQKLTLEVLARQVMGILELRSSLKRQQEDERFYRLILDSAVDYGIITLDPAGRVTSWNKGATHLLGWNEEEMLGQDCLRFFKAEDRAAGVIKQEMAAALSEGSGAQERWHIRKDGSEFWASGEMLPLTDESGLPIGFLKVIHDRTEQYLAQRSLEASEAWTRLALDAAGLGAWESTPSLRELHWDARTRELLGHGPDDQLDYHHSFLARVHPEDRERTAASIAAALAPGGGTLDTEYRTISTVDGRERHIHARGALSHRPDGTEMFIGTVQDVTEARAAESHHRLLADELQHRIKNTLAVVQSIVSQSLRSAATPAEGQAVINARISTLSIAHDLLNETSWTVAPIHSIVEGAVRIHGSHSGRIVAHGPDVLLSARPALALSMLLHELCTNAVKYGALSNEVGQVDVRWSIEREACSGDEQLIFIWQETGGPPVSPPKATGFGTRLMKALCRDLAGSGQLDYLAEGVQWRLVSNRAEICQ